MNKISKLILLVMFMMILTTATTYAQGSADPAGPGSLSGSGQFPSTGNNDNPTGGVPFDGGLSLILIAAGAGLRDKNAKKELVVLEK